MWDLIVSVPDHCLSFYLFLSTLLQNKIVPRFLLIEFIEM